jgi:amidase
MSPDVEINADLGFASASQLQQEISQGAITSEELVGALLERIEQVDRTFDGIHSVLAVNAQALADAAAADAEGSKGRLAGVPILIKDNIEAVGLPGTAGSLALDGRTVVHDAALVARLRANGAIILGSTNLSEWANIRSSKSTSGWSAVGGLTANPWKYAHSAGGSSSGSGAAIAAGLAPFAVGTETNGSIICPASLNGLVGIKPTVGVVPTQGVVPISASQDSPGPLARSVKDAALLLEVLGDLSGLVEACSDTRPLTIGVVPQWFTSHDATNALFENTVTLLAAAGIAVKTVNVPEITEEIGEDEGVILFNELVEDLSAYLAQRPGDGVKSLADVVAFNVANAERELHHFHQDYLELALASGGRNEVYHQARTRAMHWAIEEVLKPSLAQVDVLIGPTYGPAWVSRLGEGDDFSSAGWITTPSAIAGWPIGAVPMGLVDGLPVGLGVVARAHDELGLVRAMARIEAALSLGTMRPTFLR